MKKIVSLLLSLLMLCLASMAMAETTVTANPGDILTLDIVLTSGGGETASIGINTNDAPVTFVSASGCTPNDVVPPNGDSGFAGKFNLWNLSGIELSADGSVISGDPSNYTIQTLAAGQIGTLTFQVNDDAAAGTYTVEAYVALGSVAVDSKITFTIEEQVPDKLLGDVNGDGVVDGRDSVRLMKYLLDSTVQIVDVNSDVNEDGVIDGRDSIRLMKMLLV